MCDERNNGFKTKPGNTKAGKLSTSVGRPIIRPENQIEFTVISFSWRNVMKKLVLPLLLLVAFGMLAAVESDPSNVVGYVKYPSYTGLNLVGYPMGTDTIAEDAIAPYMPNVSSIAIWQANLVPQGFNAINYDPDFGEWDGSLPLALGNAMFINALANMDYYSLGAPIANQTYTLYTGLNFITVPLNRSDLLTAEDLANEVGTITSVAWFYNSSHSWDSINYDPDFGEWDGTHSITIGDCLNLNSGSGTVWPVRGSVVQPSRARM